MSWRTIALFITLTFSLAGCSKPPACEQLVSRLCAAAGEVACQELKAKPLSDQSSCQAVLDDTKKLNAQLDALVAATAAKALNAPKTQAPTDSK